MLLENKKIIEKLRSSNLLITFDKREKYKKLNISYFYLN